MLIAVTLTAWVYFISTTRPNTIVNNRFTSFYVLAATWLFITIRLFNTTDLSNDMTRYIRRFNLLQDIPFFQIFDHTESDYLFSIFTWFIAQISSNSDFYRLLIWSTISFFIIIAVKKIFESYQSLIVIFSYFTFFFVYNFVTNIARQGIAISLLLLAISIVVSQRKNKKFFYISIVTAPLFHLSALPFSILIFLFKKINFKLSFVIIFWFLSMLSFITGINSRLISGLNIIIPYLDRYASSSLISYYGSSNRIDFLIFSTFFLILGLIFYKLVFDKNESYRTLLVFFSLFNSLYLLTGFVAYSDRVAIYSWILIPLLVWYPVFKSENVQVKKYRLVITFILLSAFVLTSGITKSLVF